MDLFKLTGTWESAFFEVPPNYGVNYTNWIDCVWSAGEIQLQIEIRQDNSVFAQLKAPAQFPGGVKGYVKLVEGEVVKTDKLGITIDRPVQPILLKLDSRNPTELGFLLWAREWRLYRIA